MRQESTLINNTFTPRLYPRIKFGFTWLAVPLSAWTISTIYQPLFSVKPKFRFNLHNWMISFILLLDAVLKDY